MAASLLIARRASAHASALSRRTSLNLLSSNGSTACTGQRASTAAAVSHAMFATLSAASSGSATPARRTKDAAAAPASTSTATGGAPKKSKVNAFKLASAAVSTPASAASSAAAAAAEANIAADDNGTAGSTDHTANAHAVSFASLGLGSHIVKRAARLRFEAPTLIQQMVGRYLLYLIQLTLFQSGVHVIDLFQMYS
jgi:hypothetical protein